MASKGEEFTVPVGCASWICVTVTLSCPVVGPGDGVVTRSAVSDPTVAVDTIEEEEAAAE